MTGAVDTGRLSPPGGLAWGRTFVMCPPLHFGVLYEINPWMSREVEVAPDVAVEQCQGTLDAAVGDRGGGLDVGGFGTFSDRRGSRPGHFGGLERAKCQQPATGANGWQNAGR